jgi:hypothetical protein
MIFKIIISELTTTNEEKRVAKWVASEISKERINPEINDTEGSNMALGFQFDSRAMIERSKNLSCRIK